MPKVVYTDHEGRSWVIDADIGESVMAAAVKNGVPGIVGECGGNASCATCHVWVGAEFVDRVGPAVDLEDDLLDLAVSERRDESRLSCQVRMAAELDGLVVEIPPDQP